jgi:hypothetical protein
MAERNAGLEFFRVFALFNAHQWHLVGPFRMWDFPDAFFYRKYYVAMYVCLCFSMSGLFQIGSLFSIRKPFRARGLVCFWIALIAYCHGCSFVFRMAGLPDGYNDTRVRWPITQKLSWFFTAHTHMTILTPLLHGGMLSMNRHTYARLNVVMVVLILLSGPRGVFVKENGFNWMSACGMYVFAGFFSVHGWPFPGWLTWIIWGLIFRCEWYLSHHDLMAEVHPKIAWLFTTFEMRESIRPRGRMGGRIGVVIYSCPLTFVWGAAALFAFRLLPFPQAVSKFLFFMGGKVFLIHLFDMLPVFNSAATKWTRCKELSMIPWTRFKNLILTTVQFGNLGFFLEIFREKIFLTTFQVMEWMVQLGKYKKRVHNR